VDFGLGDFGIFVRFTKSKSGSDLQTATTAATTERSRGHKPDLTDAELPGFEKRQCILNTSIKFQQKNDS
jgi:hypothetical protein